MTARLPAACGIIAESNGMFAFDDVSERIERLAAIVVALDRAGEPADLVAWFPGTPTQWWLRTGNTVLLGADRLGDAEWGNGDARLYSSPARWWAADDARGACVVNWGKLDPALDFAGLRSLACDAPALLRRLNRAFADTARQVIRPHLNVHVVQHRAERAAA